MARPRGLQSEIQAAVDQQTPETATLVYRLGLYINYKQHEVEFVAPISIHSQNI